ncbi:MAG: glycosyltransferase family 4 protein [Candidatus Paceibacterota bacterium]
MSNKPIKIALIYDAIFPFVKGGSEKRFYEIGRRLARDGDDVHLYGMKTWEGPNVIRQEGITLHGICKKYPLYIKSGKRSIFQPLLFGLATFRLWREPFDVVDCCGFPYFSLFPMRLITWIRKKPLCSTWHEVWGRKYWKEYLGKLGIFGYGVEYIAVRLPDVIISVSDNTTKDIRNHLGRKGTIVTITNGIDLEKIRAVERAKETSDVIFVGRLLPYKNVDKLIEAVAVVKKKYPKIVFFIIGDGPERDKLEKLVEDLDLKENVRFFGFLEREEEVFSYMKSSKMLALPSSREGFGIVVLESGACDLPVLTIDHSKNAARHLIKNNNGIVTKLDTESLAVGITELLRNTKNWELQQDIEDYDWDKITQAVRKQLHF